MLRQFNPESKEFLNPAAERGFLVAQQPDGSVSDHRLVKARKSATQPQAAELTAYLAKEKDFLERQWQKHWLAIGGLETKQKALADASERQSDFISHYVASEWRTENPDPFEALEKFDEQRANDTGYRHENRPDRLSQEEIENRQSINETTPANLENQLGAGRYALIESRKWANEYRIRTQVDTMTRNQLQEQSGERVTSELSLRGARAIADSCEYMALHHGGYKTFLTLTLDDEARQRLQTGYEKFLEIDAPCTLINWEPKARFYYPCENIKHACSLITYKPMTIQKEVKRFFDAANQVFRRGFTYKNDKGETVKVEPFHGAPDNWKDENGKMQPLPYCWVIENPKNENGEDNPHLHVLLGWRIAYKHFDAWAKRLEKLWGQGFAHLEKIKEAEHAGAYMAKAAGYLSKAAGAEDQGLVVGNRYWISKPSRAAGWECEGRYQMGEMGGLINDVYRFMQFKYGDVFKQRAELSKAAADIRKQAKEGIATPEKKRESISRALLKTRKFIKELPARATKYSLIIKGEANLNTFLQWANRPYCKDHTPKRLHKDGDLKPYWLPVAFQSRQGWTPKQHAGTGYFEQLKIERLRRAKKSRSGENAVDEFGNNASELDGKSTGHNWAFA